MSSVKQNPANVETVDFKRHGKLKVKANPGFVHAKNSNLAAICLSELGDSASNFPHVFIQNPQDSKFLLTAVLGLQSEENVYFGEQFWESTHVPLSLQRHPFVIGYDDRLPEREEITTCIETDSPFLSESSGQALFGEDGKQTDFFRSRHQLLNTLFEGEKLTVQFVQKLVELNLLAPLVIKLQRQSGKGRTINGIFTIDETRLKTLSAEQLKTLQDQNFLAPCYLILASLYQLKKLIRRRNQQGGEQLVNFQIEIGQPGGQANQPGPA